MQKLKRSKPYKAIMPEETIKWCKTILEDLGLETFEDLYNSHENNDMSFWYCRVGFKQFPNYSAGGKGQDKKYALASGYGELIERLQNNLLIPLAEDRKYSHAPDEKYFSLKEIVANNLEILSSIFQTSNESDLEKSILNIYGDKILTLPYFDILADTIHYLPVGITENFINMYNGNCAGNNNNEAIIHGVCEIIERYAIREIYKNEYRLPDIPIDYFKDFEIYDRIKYLESEKNISVIIKDCSIGEKLPVIGVILIDRTNNKYSFQLGSDPSPVTALERCFTEVFQDGRNFAHFTHIGIDPFKEDGFYDRSTLKAQNYVYTNDFARGKWPNSIFLPSKKEFKGFDYIDSESDEKDLKYLLDLLEENKRKIFIRDVSFLGFPSFNVFIPGMSEYVITDPEKYAVRQKEFMKNIPVLKNINGYDKEKVQGLAEILDNLVKDPEPFIPFNISLFFKNISDEIGTDLNNELFLFLLYYRIEDYGKASIYINRYLSESGISEEELNAYYLCIRDLVSLKHQNIQEHSICKLLYKVYTSELVDEVFEDMSEPSNIFQHFDLPSCPNCNTCVVKQKCSLNGLVDISQKFSQKIREASIDQEKLNGFMYQLKEECCEYTA
ncbi:MAG: YcaO-like family protein [Bacteroidales bacterium]|nr:YcaO-like family protein [Bacteroidales bacterium]